MLGEDLSSILFTDSDVVLDSVHLLYLFSEGDVELEPSNFSMIEEIALESASFTSMGDLDLCFALDFNPADAANLVCGFFRGDGDLAFSCLLSGDSEDLLFFSLQLIVEYRDLD